jgi:hypothetical protein
MRHRRQVGEFEKIKSNAVGDPYVEPGFYDLRKPGPRGYGTGSMGTTMSGHALNAKSFTYSGSQKLVRKSEFEHHHNGAPAKKVIESSKGFMTSKIADPFTNMNKIGYSLDPYERKQDLSREEYAK